MISLCEDQTLLLLPIIIIIIIIYYFLVSLRITSEELLSICCLGLCEKSNMLWVLKLEVTQDLGDEAETIGF